MFGPGFLKHRSRVILAALGLSGLLVIWMVGGTSVATSVLAPLEPGERTKSIVLEVDRDSWRRSVTKHGETGDNYTATLLTKARTRADLDAYRERNRSWAVELERSGTGPLDVHVTLTKTVRLSEITRISTDLGLQIGTIYTRGVDTAGVRHTGLHLVATTAGSAGPQAPSRGTRVGRIPSDAEVASSLESINHDGSPPPPGMTERPKVAYQGVTDFTATVPTARYAALSSTPNVYLVDVTRTLVRNELVQKIGRQPNTLTVNSNGLFWDLEETGIVAKPSPSPR